MFDHHSFDFGRVRVESANDVHVLLAIGDVDVAEVVHDDDVTRVEPVVIVSRFRHSPVAHEVTGRDLVAAHQQFTRLPLGHIVAVIVDNANLNIVDDTTGGFRDELVWVAHQGVGDDAGCLGHAVSGRDISETEPGSHRLDHLHRYRCRTSDAAAQRREVVVVEVWVVEKSLVQRWGSRENCHFLALDDRGYICITGRSKDVIIRGGENIPVVEVENLLYRHPSLAQVAIVAYPDERLGERACAVVVAKPGESFDFDTMIAFLNESKVAKNYLPERLVVLDAMPTTPSGKIQKFKLRDMILAE